MYNPVIKDTNVAWINRIRPIDNGCLINKKINDVEIEIIINIMI